MQINELKEKLIADYDRMGLSDIASYVTSDTVHTIVNRADLILDGVFLFDKPWDMERCDTPFDLGNEFESYDWNIILNDDKEWCYMLNRMDYLEDLVLASILTDDSKYANTAKRLIMSWLEAHRDLEYSDSTRPLDTAIRLRSWARVLAVLVKLQVLDLFELCLVYNSVVSQVEYLRSSWTYEYMMSNWGIIQTSSIIEVLGRLGFDSDDDNLVWAKDNLGKQLVSQVYPDGVNWEMSPMYHVELILYLIGCTKAMKDNNLKVLPNIERRICAMTYALSHQILNQTSIDAIGDSDAQDVSQVLALSSCVLHNSEFKYLAGKACPSVFDILAFGTSIIKEYDELPTFKYASIFFDGVDSGIFSARNNWEDNSNTTIFLNGPLGGRHGHADNLHFSCAYKGMPIFIDSGRYTYREDRDIRPYLKSAKAHNTLMVDDSCESSPQGGWTFDSFVTPIKTFTNHIREAHYFEGGFIDKKSYSFVTRRLFFIDSGIWVGFDDVMSQGAHSLDTRFHVNPDLTTTKVDDSKVLLDDNLQFVTSDTNTLLTGKCSRVYNTLEDQSVIYATHKFDNFGKSYWCLCDKEYQIEKVDVLQDGRHVVDDSICDAIKVIVSDEEWYTFVVFHTEIYTGTKAFEVEGIPFNAKSVCVHVKGKKKSYKMFRA